VPRLPVSGIGIHVRAPDGADDLLLLEQPVGPTLAVGLLSRLVTRDGGGVLDAADLPVADIEAVLIRLRQLLLGDRLVGEARCASERCGSRMDVMFGLEDYLDHHRPRALRRIAPASEAGWFETSDGGSFRIPSGADLLAVEASANPESALAKRCLRPANGRPGWRRRAESAMEVLAPSLSGLVQGACPACHERATFLFDVPWFVLTELRAQALDLYDDIHLIASRYQWSEERILALPRPRRMRYAELIRDEAAA
jgi:hypothetical protein